MKTQAFDIAVIGGGVIGLTLVRALRREGASVVVVDASLTTEPTTIPAATQAAAGMLAPSFEHATPQSVLDEALYRLGAHGLALWPDFAAALEDETGVFIDYQGNGALGVAYDDTQADALSAQAQRVSALGGTAQMISGDAARVMEPALSREIIAALYAPADAQVDPRRLTTALRASLKKNDAALVSGRAAQAQMTSAGGAVTLDNGETLEAEKIVIAAGAVSGLAPQDLVFPVKGAALAVASSALSRVVRAPGAYLCPKAEGRLVIGATEEPGRDDLEVDPVLASGLHANAGRAAPALGDAPEIERWAGLRPGTPDGAPILGCDETGRFLALGHYRNGVLHAPAAAAAMAALILGRPPVFEIAPFALSRFSPGQNG